MEIAALSPSRSSLEKKPKLESIDVGLSSEGFLVEDELPTICQEGEPLLTSMVFLRDGLD